jgi:hypothetical protein
MKFELRLMPWSKSPKSVKEVMWSNTSRITIYGIRVRPVVSITQSGPNNPPGLPQAGMRAFEGVVTL